MKQGGRKIGKQAFSVFATAPSTLLSTPSYSRTWAVFARRDDIRAKIRADEIPGPRLLSGSTRFKIYPRRVAFAIPTRSPRVCNSFGRRRARSRPDSRTLGRACGDSHKHASSIEPWTRKRPGLVYRRTRRFHAGIIWLRVLCLLNVPLDATLFMYLRNRRPTIESPPKWVCTVNHKSICTGIFQLPTLSDFNLFINTSLALKTYIIVDTNFEVCLVKNINRSKFAIGNVSLYRWENRMIFEDKPHWLIKVAAW